MVEFDLSSDPGKRKRTFAWLFLAAMGGLSFVLSPFALLVSGIILGKALVVLAGHEDSGGAPAAPPPRKSAAAEEKAPAMPPKSAAPAKPAPVKSMPAPAAAPAPAMARRSLRASFRKAAEKTVAFAARKLVSAFNAVAQAVHPMQLIKHLIVVAAQKLHLHARH